MTPNILIIGYGFIGQALDSHLCSIGNWNVSTYNWESRDFGYDDITWYNLEEYSHVILLAGNSSVGRCKNLLDTFDQNVAKFVGLIDKLKTTGSQLIYASSASTYVNSGRHPVTEDYPLGKADNYYDLSKQALDKMAEAAKNPCIGLRFGTLSGQSPRPRLDVLINKLVYDAQTKKEIKVNNVENYRAVLGMKDLCRAIQAIIEHPAPPSGIYNLASYSATIGYFALQTQKAYEDLSGQRINLVKTPDTGTYSFNLDCSKFRDTFNFTFQDTVASIVEDAMRNYVPSEEELYMYLRG